MEGPVSALPGVGPKALKTSVRVSPKYYSLFSGKRNF